MRIRKNANLSSLMFSHASGTEVLQTHVCQLNQSPWDVIPFSQEAYQSSHLHQYEGEDSFSGNGSLADSIGAVESSVASLMEYDPEDKAAIKIKVNNMVIVDDDNYEIRRINQEKKTMSEEDCEFNHKLKKGEKIYCCNKIDGKEWHCKNELKEGHSMCDHHILSSLKSSYNNNVTSACIASPTNSPSIKKPEKAVAGTRRGRGKGAKKGQSSSSNPYEFYYYSGFGPLWGKRRGDRGEGNKNESKESEISGAIAIHHNTTPFSAPLPIEDHQELDFVDEDDDDDEDSEGGDIGKKRMRKPVKARSLKSLM
ncbi:uncharacterized protein LOC8261910 isoform X2 [Ricinus communis]|uniref:uncharacterized protein LOC8261910 isoform X2 n=1 Tax=Ricinus communis TaxID=3988 RepID=UPI000772470D|nr:uncharacterized protein LOC8261910 isoform X2 [Ricinus communis]|eukprot:XP_015583881.1 uncharacterized protein LOC8261910 isoform X2 [Ricinus communis]